MANDHDDARADLTPVFLAWGMPAFEVHEGYAGNAALWLTGGATLLLWTALALLLTTS